MSPSISVFVLCRPWIDATNGGVDELDGVKNRPVIPQPACRRRDLDRATRVRGGNDVGCERGDVARLALTELRGRLGLNEVVDARAAAADVRLERGRERHAWNGLQQRAWLRADALTVREVTG